MTCARKSITNISSPIASINNPRASHSGFDNKKQTVKKAKIFDNVLGGFINLP
jgi:hypothetical protein